MINFKEDIIINKLLLINHNEFYHCDLLLGLIRNNYFGLTKEDELDIFTKISNILFEKYDMMSWD